MHRVVTAIRVAMALVATMTLASLAAVLALGSSAVIVPIALCGSELGLVACLCMSRWRVGLFRPIDQ